MTLADGASGLLAHCKRAGCTFGDILTAASIAPGTFASRDPAKPLRREAEQSAEAAKRARQAQTLWREAEPIRGTVVETYLRGRGITCDPPPVLRFHPEAWHGPTARRLPALVALVEGGQSFAVHRTWLRADGSGKADVDPPKAMLGTVAGGAVRLAVGSGPLVVAEGIETALSLASDLLQSPATVWAALSTSGIRGLQLPAQPGRLTIAPDGDEPGRTAAHALAERAHGFGWRVAFLDPGDGRDWNDILTGKAAST
ncbi:DUF7146 domain-containing protein [Seohaeicola sp.]|uniref:DUF7146 domain-containing protein n=1 Tax=Seohaeicola sp. TaxID=2042026 RepID=UPI003A84F13A